MGGVTRIRKRFHAVGLMRININSILPILLIKLSENMIVCIITRPTFAMSYNGRLQLLQCIITAHPIVQAPSIQSQPPGEIKMKVDPGFIRPYLNENVYKVSSDSGFW